ncbi:MAG: hypothetical protein WCI52_00755 [bacterium]
MGKSNRGYIENIARTLMGQLDVSEDEVGIDSYAHDYISVRIRVKLCKRVFQDIRHMRLETLARIADYGIVGAPKCQNESPAWEKLQSGEEPCTMSHLVVWDEKNWLQSVSTESPRVVIRHMAALAIVAAMYDITVRNRKPSMCQPVGKS